MVTVVLDGAPVTEISSRCIRCAPVTVDAENEVVEALEVPQARFEVSIFVPAVAGVSIALRFIWIVEVPAGAEKH